MAVIKRAYMNIHDTFEPYTKTNLPDWFVNSSKRKVIRVLGVTATTTDINWIEPSQPPQIRFPAEIRLFSNLAHDEPWSNIPKLSKSQVVGAGFVPEGFNFVMMLNNYNSVKEFDITYSNLKQLEFRYVNMKGFLYEFFGDNVITDIIIELELVLSELD
jgi:hypothetical protein